MGLGQSVGIGFRVGAPALIITPATLVPGRSLVRTADPTVAGP